MARTLKIDPGRLYRHLNVLGWSLGAATALQFATHARVERLILAAPFTSTMDMGRMMVNPLLNALAWHRFDNRARLAELARRPDRPEVVIMHMDKDAIVPVDMGRALAREFAGWVRYRELPEQDNLDPVMSHMVPFDELLGVMFPRAAQVAKGLHPAK